jgi:two-component system, LytTR family, sensor kinase
MDATGPIDPYLVDPYLAGDLFGFTAGLIVTVLLVVLTLRTARLPGAMWPNLGVALCSLIWNLGGLIHAAAVAAGVLKNSGLALCASAIQFTGAACWPVPLMAIWSRYATRPWQVIGFRVLRIASFLTATLITGALWATTFLGVSPLPMRTLMYLASYNASFLAVAGVLLAMRTGAESRSIRLPSLAVTGGVLFTTLAVVAQTSLKPGGGARALLDVIANQSVLIIVLGAFLFFARFRFADQFIRYSIRILLAGAVALGLILLIEAPFVSMLGGLVAFPRAVHIFVTSLLASGLLLFFAFIDRKAGVLVNRCILGVHDYRNAVRALAEELNHLDAESDISSAVTVAAQHNLELDDVSLFDIGRLPAPLWPTQILDGDVAELGPDNAVGSLLSLPDVELFVPVRTGGRVSSVLAISPGRGRRSLVSQEIVYLRAVATSLGDRLDALRFERDAIERRSRETVLLQQVTEAELRALRAQVNPHFLFNALNSIANLIAANPAGAEAMTLRLAKVFRHVLASSLRLLTSVQEEAEFLRTYLQIEEARFGDRLHVEIEVAPEVAADHMPSLVLQPLVENALKHGLAPKPGPGHLWISARALGDQLCLKVEDDGLGIGSGMRPATNGVGLTNVTRRLAALYQERAQVSLERRDPGGGTRVTILLPRQTAVNGHEKPHS